MNIFISILLGIIQGLTEFLPISSTAHLTLAGEILGLFDPQHPEQAQQWTAFIATIQLGTLVSVLIYFYNDLVAVTKQFCSQNLSSKKIKYSQQSLQSKLGWFIILGTLPIVTFGLVFKKIIEGTLTKDPFVMAISLIAVAILLFIAERVAKLKKEEKDLSIKDAIIIGFAQCLALVPGSSRSGSTIMAGLFLGMKRDVAARFSFLLSIPAVLASGLLEFVQSLKDINSADLVSLVIATIAAAISGYFAIAFLLKFLKTKSTLIFIIYRIALGIGIFMYLFAY